MRWLKLTGCGCTTCGLTAGLSHLVSHLSMLSCTELWYYKFDTWYFAFAVTVENPPLWIAAIATWACFEHLGFCDGESRLIWYELNFVACWQSDVSRKAYVRGIGGASVPTLRGLFSPWLIFHGFAPFLCVEWHYVSVICNTMFRVSAGEHGNVMLGCYV